MENLYEKIMENQRIELIKEIKSIAKDIISDDEWVNDSHSNAEYIGIKDGLTRLIRHLEETQTGGDL